MTLFYFLSELGTKLRFTPWIVAIFIVITYTANDVSGQHNKIMVSGVVSDGSITEVETPLVGVVIGIADYSTYSTTDRYGRFTLNNIPAGPVNISASMLGYVPVDTLVNLRAGMSIKIVMQQENFRIEQIQVTAETNKSGQATSSLISRTAMEHLQTTSLSDVMSLLPGGMAKNQTLDNAQYITLRGAYSSSQGKFNDATNLNAMGVSIVKDGAPVSNNANLSAISSTVIGATVGQGGVASPSSGIDARNISMDNVESVEIIRGITPAEYGDIMSGAIIINSKAGREPLRVSAQMNPNVYGFSAGAGYKLKDKQGALNYNVGYTRNTNDIVQSHLYFERVNAKVLYSNSYFKGKWRSNISFDYLYSQNVRKRNPDDRLRMLSSNGKRQSLTLNANGTVNVNWGWWKNIQYVASVSYSPSKSYSQEQYSDAIATYSTTTTDGAILSNIAGKTLFDSDGNQITNFTDLDAMNYAHKLNSIYLGRYDVDSKEVNIFFKLKSSFVKTIGKINNRIVVGADFKSDGNEGKGTKFSNHNPPRQNKKAPFASFRQRSYKDIPYINQVGVFVEESFTWNIGKRALRIQAGLRYDNVSVAGGLLSPRLNASLDIFPKLLSLRGGYGIEGKMPTLIYLYPERAYFEYTNLDNLAQDVDQSKKYLVTTTRVFDSQNKKLDIAYTKKMELGFDLNYKQYHLTFTAFKNSTDNGYKLGYDANSFHLASFHNYLYNTSTDKIDKTGTRSVLLHHARPTNSVAFETKGMEFILNLGRFNAIRTAFVIDGEWKRTKAYNNRHDYRYLTNSIADYHVGIFAPGAEKNYDEKFQTNLRITHNVPQIGFVITMTVEALWKEAFWSRYNNAIVPVKYISKYDGLTYDFPVDYKSDPEFSVLAYKDDHYDTNKIKQDFKPLFNFNVNVTKEIGDWMRVSFFANNMFRYYQRVLDPRKVNEYVKRNKNYFFGVSMSLLIK